MTAVATRIYGKKALGLNEQNNNFTRASPFLYISLPSLYDYNMKLPTLL